MPAVVQDGRGGGAGRRDGEGGGHGERGWECALWGGDHEPERGPACIYSIASAPLSPERGRPLSLSRSLMRCAARHPHLPLPLLRGGKEKGKKRKGKKRERKKSGWVLVCVCLCAGKCGHAGTALHLSMSIYSISLASALLWCPLRHDPSGYAHAPNRAARLAYRSLGLAMAAASPLVPSAQCSALHAPAGQPPPRTPPQDRLHTQTKNRSAAQREREEKK